jgi:hypothetical protein
MTFRWFGWASRLFIHLPNIVEVNVDPLGLVVEEGGARVLPE